MPLSLPPWAAAAKQRSVTSNLAMVNNVDVIARASFPSPELRGTIRSSRHFGHDPRTTQNSEEMLPKLFSRYDSVLSVYSTHVHSPLVSPEN